MLSPNRFALSAYTQHTKVNIPILNTHFVYEISACCNLIVPLHSQRFSSVNWRPLTYISFSLAANTLAATRISTRRFWGRGERPIKPSPSIRVKEHHRRCCQTPCHRLSCFSTLQDDAVSRGFPFLILVICCPSPDLRHNCIAAVSSLLRSFYLFY
jgi:hypothetical protein